MYSLPFCWKIVDELFAPAEKEQVGTHDERVDSEFRKRSEGGVELVRGACAQDMRRLHSERTRAILHCSRFRFGIGIVRVDQQSSDCGLGHHFAQKLNTLSNQLRL